MSNGFTLIELLVALALAAILATAVYPGFSAWLLDSRRDAMVTAALHAMHAARQFAAVRAVWPAHLPMSVRISAHDWVEGGITPSDAVQIARAFKAAGADLIDCSSGQVSVHQKPTYGRMYQTPFADRIRNEVGIATIAVGAIYEADHVNSIIAAGRADLCAVARPHLANPAWTLTEAAKIGFTAIDWPRQYRTAKPQMEANFQRERAAALAAVTPGSAQ